MASSVVLSRLEKLLIGELLDTWLCLGHSRGRRAGELLSQWSSQKGVGAMMQQAHNPSAGIPSYVHKLVILPRKSAVLDMFTHRQTLLL